MEAIMCELYAIKPFLLGGFCMWVFLWKFRAWGKVKTYEIREI